MKSAITSLILLLMALVVMGASAEPAKRTAPAAPSDPFADNACVQCHRDLAGRSSEIVDLEWKQSVHYAAKVGCDGCHGGNPALKREQFTSDEAFKRAAHLDRNPEFLVLHDNTGFVSNVRGRSISYFCGKCHAKIKENHLGSPHGEFGDPTCLYCHANHDVQGKGSHKITHPTPQSIIDTRTRAEGGRCTPCHRAGTMETVGRIKNILIGTEEQIKISGEQYQQLEAWGYHNLELEKLHHHANEVNSALRQTFHSFNLRDISNYAGEIQGVVDRTTVTYELIKRLRETQRQQTIIGLSAVGLLLSFAGLLVYYKKSFHH